MADETATADTAAPPAAPTGNGDAPDWRGTLPEDLRADPSLKDFKDVGGLAKSYVETKKLVGAQGIKPPADDAPDEEWGAYYGKLGRPESPEKYTFKPPALPEGMGEVDAEGLDGFRKQAHAVGLTDRQAQGILDWYGTYHVAGVDKLTQHTATERKGAETALKAEWGAAYPRNISLARQTVRDLFADSPTLASAVENAGNNADLVRGLVRIGERMLEHGEITGNVPAGESASDLDAKIEKMAADPNAQNWKRETLDEYAALLQRRERLRERERK